MPYAVLNLSSCRFRGNLTWPYRIKDLSCRAALNVAVAFICDVVMPVVSLDITPVPVSLALFYEKLLIQDCRYIVLAEPVERNGNVTPAFDRLVGLDVATEEFLAFTRSSHNRNYFASKGYPLLECHLPKYDELVYYEECILTKIPPFKGLYDPAVYQPMYRPLKDPPIETSMTMKSLLVRLLRTGQQGQGTDFSWQTFTHDLRCLGPHMVSKYLYQLTFLLRNYSLSTELELANQSSILMERRPTKQKPKQPPKNPLELFLLDLCSSDIKMAVSYYWLLFSQCEDPVYGTLYSKIMNSFLARLEQVFGAL